MTLPKPVQFMWLVLWKTRRSRLWTFSGCYNKRATAVREFNRRVESYPEIDHAVRLVQVRP